MSDSTVQLSLSEDEAIVLFEFLSRFQDNDELQIEDPAEERVLWDLQASLESLLLAPLTSKYKDRLADARKNLAHE